MPLFCYDDRIWEEWQMRDRKRVYLEIWSRIEDSYFDSYMVSEHGLQAALYEEFRKTLPNVHVVVEPTWNVGDQKKEMHPDLVIVEKGQITDIFELKFKPQGCPVFEEDIQKLLQYGANSEQYPVLGPKHRTMERNCQCGTPVACISLWWRIAGLRPCGRNP